ncbi:MAG: histidine phosphatase family protein [Geminicoccaceae bacterium]|nr:histidine phosphatase family protein [Geminicoccaceae bacterium]
MLRHGPTDWNRLRLLQGRQDRALDERGRKEVTTWRLPSDVLQQDCLTSPLRRAVETARILGYTQSVNHPALIEMDWGMFEGRNLRDLRNELGEEMVRNEARGLDFRPPGGESPREVATRFHALIKEFCQLPKDRVLVTHKGVRRAALALATGWDMLGKPPVRLGDDDALVLDIRPHTATFLSASPMAMR